MKIKKRPLFKVGDRVMFREATSQNSGSWENPIKVYIVTGICDGGRTKNSCTRSPANLGYCYFLGTPTGHGPHFWEEQLVRIHIA